MTINRRESSFTFIRDVALKYPKQTSAVDAPSQIVMESPFGRLSAKNFDPYAPNRNTICREANRIIVMIGFMVLLNIDVLYEGRGDDPRCKSLFNDFSLNYFT